MPRTMMFLAAPAIVTAGIAVCGACLAGMTGTAQAGASASLPELSAYRLDAEGMAGERIFGTSLSHGGNGAAASRLKAAGIPGEQILVVRRFEDGSAREDLFTIPVP